MGRGERIQADVLAVLNRRQSPCSAYELLDALRPAYPKIAPTTIYRALGALTRSGRVHRLESINAFIVCQCGDHGNASILAICDACGAVEESIAPAVLQQLSGIAARSGFAPTRHVVELHGRCAACGQEAAE